MGHKEGGGRDSCQPPQKLLDGLGGSVALSLSHLLFLPALATNSRNPKQLLSIFHIVFPLWVQVFQVIECMIGGAGARDGRGGRGCGGVSAHRLECKFHLCMSFQLVLLSGIVFYGLFISGMSVTALSLIVIDNRWGCGAGSGDGSKDLLINYAKCCAESSRQGEWPNQGGASVFLVLMAEFL